MVSLSNHERSPSSRASGARPGIAGRWLVDPHPRLASIRLLVRFRLKAGMTDWGALQPSLPAALMVSLSNRERSPSSRASGARPGIAGHWLVDPRLAPTRLLVRSRLKAGMTDWGALQPSLPAALMVSLSNHERSPSSRASGARPGIAGRWLVDPRLASTRLLVRSRLKAGMTDWRALQPSLPAALMVSPARSPSSRAQRSDPASVARPMNGLLRCARSDGNRP